MSSCIFVSRPAYNHRFTSSSLPSLSVSTSTASRDISNLRSTPNLDTAFHQPLTEALRFHAQLKQLKLILPSSFLQKRSLAGPTVSSTPSRGIQHSFYLTRHSFAGHQLLRHGSNTKRPGMHSQLPRSLLLHHCPCHFHYIVCSFGTGTYSYTYACIGRCCI